jgi:hypothetical protein
VVFSIRPETKRQRMQWKTQNSPRPQKSTHVSLAFEDHALCFFDHKGIDHYEFIAQGKTVNEQFYLELRQSYGNLYGGKDPRSGLTSGFSTVAMHVRMLSYESASSWLGNPLQKWTIHLIHIT